MACGGEVFGEPADGPSYGQTQEEGIPERTCLDEVTAEDKGGGDELLKEIIRP